jgi:hypothetical protein
MHLVRSKLHINDKPTEQINYFNYSGNTICLTDNLDLEIKLNKFIEQKIKAGLVQCWYDSPF